MTESLRTLQLKAARALLSDESKHVKHTYKTDDGRMCAAHAIGQAVGIDVSEQTMNKELSEKFNQEPAVQLLTVIADDMREGYGLSRREDWGAICTINNQSYQATMRMFDRAVAESEKEDAALAKIN